MPVFRPHQRRYDVVLGTTKAATYHPTVFNEQTSAPPGRVGPSLIWIFATPRARICCSTATAASCGGGRRIRSRTLSAKVSFPSTPRSEMASRSMGPKAEPIREQRGHLPVVRRDLDTFDSVF